MNEKKINQFNKEIVVSELLRCSNIIFKRTLRDGTDFVELNGFKLYKIFDHKKCQILYKRFPIICMRECNSNESFSYYRGRNIKTTFHNCDANSFDLSKPIEKEIIYDGIIPEVDIKWTPEKQADMVCQSVYEFDSDGFINKICRKFSVEEDFVEEDFSEEIEKFKKKWKKESK